VETKNGFYSGLLSNLLTVLGAVGNADFSVWRSNVQRGAKKLTDTAENTIKCLFFDNVGDSGWGQRAVEAEEVRGKTSNVRSSHGGSAHGFGLPVIPGGSDVPASSPDVNGRTKIGEIGLCIINSRSGDSDRLQSAGRGVVSRVPVIVSCGYDDSDAAVVKLEMGSRVSGVVVTPYRPAHTALTARFIILSLSPATLIDTTEGPPVLRTSSATQSMPAIL